MEPPIKSQPEWVTVAQKLKAEGLLNKEIAKQVGKTPGRVSQVLGQRRAKS